nr:hypothetical protein [Tanacetum cinerariifolium]
HGGEVGKTWGASIYTRIIGHPSTGEHRCKRSGHGCSRLSYASATTQPLQRLTGGALRAFGSQVTPHPPPPISTNQDSPSTGSAAPSPTKTAATTKHQAWSTPDVTLQPLVSLTPEDLDMDEATGPDEQA